MFPPILALPGLWLAMAAVSTKNPQSLTRGRLLEEQLPQISFWVTHPALVPFRLGCENSSLVVALRCVSISCWVLSDLSFNFL